MRNAQRMTRASRLGRGVGAIALAAGSAASIGGVWATGGCAGRPEGAQAARAELAPPAYSAPAPWDASTRPISESLGYPTADASAGATVVSKQRLAPTMNGEGVAASGVIQSEPGEVMRVEYHANKQDVTEVLQALLGGMLGRDYVLDATLTGLITLDIDEEMTRADLMNMIEGIAGVFGWSLEPRGSTLFIKPGTRGPRASASPILSARPAFESETPAVRVRRLRALGGDQVVAVLKEFMSETGKAVTVGRTVVMADTVRQIGRLSDLLSSLDVPAFSGVEIWTYRLAYRRPEDAAQLLTTIAASSSINSGQEPMVAFVPLPGTERLMVIAKDATIQPLILDFVKQVDTPPEHERRHRYKYSIQHYQPAALVKLLKDFFGDRMEQTASEAGEPRIRLASDPASDALLVYATPSDYGELLATLRSVDRAPQQVQLQSIIAEVSLTNRLQYGVEYFLQNESSLGSLSLTGSAPLVGVATGSALFVGADGFAVVQALDRESRTQILSQPKVFMQDRAKASIQVGGEVPVVKASEGSATQQAGTTGIREEIEYRKTGVILTLQADINESGQVKLDITQEVTDAIPTARANLPEFTTRTIQTTVVVPHGQTVLLGGIITNDKRNQTNRIPVLGRIPLLGEAFKNTDDEVKRTELLLAITPTIVNEPSMAGEQLSEFMRSVHVVRSAMEEYAADLPRAALHGQIIDGRANEDHGPTAEPANPEDKKAQPVAPEGTQEPKLLEKSPGSVGAGASSSDALAAAPAPITAPTAPEPDWLSVFAIPAMGRTTESWVMREPWKW